MSTAFLFPGQGSQYVGMGAAWYRASAEARVLYERADALLNTSLRELCFEGPVAKLDNTVHTQPALFVTSLAMWEVAREHLPAPAVVAGHSLGEFAALVVAGAMHFDDALRLVAERGRLMAQAGEHSPGGMAVLLGATFEAATALCAAVKQATGASLVIANDNCPGQIVISGEVAGLEKAMAMVAKYEIRYMRRLFVSIASHSPLMASIEGEFARCLDATPMHATKIPVVANALASPVTQPAQIRQALMHQLTRPVRWRESLLWMRSQGVARFVEIGPKAVLSGLGRRTVPDATVEAIDDKVEAFVPGTSAPTQEIG